MLDSGKKLQVLENINLTVEENQTVALLGPSGSGKSTCLRIMCGLQKTSHGEVFSNGKKLTDINNDVSMVFQSFALFPWETVKKNIEIALLPLNLSNTEMKNRIKNSIDIVGLEGFEEAYPRELSGGMKQRVGVARAIAMQRPILFLDEPFSALDVLTADTLRTEIMKIFLGKKTNTKSMVIVTHNIHEAVIMADRILVMGSNPGHIRADFINHLPYPRIPDSVTFNELVKKIHGLITETFIPDAAVSTDKTFKGPQQSAAEILPMAHIIEIVGIIEALHAEGGAVDIFVLSADIAKEFGHTLAIIKGAELLELVETPKQMVMLTADGQAFANGDVNHRKKMLHEKFEKLTLVQKTTKLLREHESFEMPIELLKEKLSEWIPTEDPDRMVEILISWGRYSEYFGYNDNTKTFYLDIGQES
jgi:NitT/TauT family transport system ATP-binding protein